jgi:TnpA family transposase
VRSACSTVVAYRGAAARAGAALKEYALVRRTIHAALYLSREDHRRRISRRLDKGESLHTLKRDVF